MVEIKSNTTVLSDEFIAHRLGLLPIISTNCTEGMRYTRVRINLLAYVLLLTGGQDCSCMFQCAYCSIEYKLHVICTDSKTLDVTSNHLEILTNRDQGEGDGDELLKRGEHFGHPVGKSAYLWAIQQISLTIHYQIDPTFPQFSFASCEKVKSSILHVPPKRFPISPRLS